MRTSQSRLNETIQMVKVRQVSIVDLHPKSERSNELEWYIRNTSSCAYLAAALTALVTERPDKLKRAMDTQIAAEIPAILGSLMI